jgi:hypothetical protein
MNAKNHDAAAEAIEHSARLDDLERAVRVGQMPIGGALARAYMLGREAAQAEAREDAWHDAVDRDLAEDR